MYLPVYNVHFFPTDKAPKIEMCSVVAIPPLAQFVYQSPAKVSVVVELKRQNVITRRCVIFKLVTSI